jgi:hypothetical protein
LLYDSQNNRLLAHGLQRHPQWLDKLPQLQLSKPNTEGGPVRVALFGWFMYNFPKKCSGFLWILYFCRRLTIKKTKTMATYTITLNERTASGRALMSYLQALGVLVEKISPKTKSSYRRSQEDKLAGRVETFSSSEEMFQSLGI